MTLTHLRPYRVLYVMKTAFPILVRYGVLYWRTGRGKQQSPEKWLATHEYAARRIEGLALHLGGIFIKLAQVLGARRDAFPEPFIRILSKFHDQVPPRPFPAIAGAIETDLGQPLESLFKSVDPTPLAAASLAQVHRGTLHDGTKIVVKIQYPEAKRLFPTDIKSARFVARIAHQFPIHIDFISIVDEIARFVGLELDFRREIKSTERVAQAFSNHPDVCIPIPITSHCSDHTIVLSFLEGIQVTHVDELNAAGHDLEQVAGKIARIYVAMIFQHGFFHGDPHPGNILVLPDGRIGLLDFGLAKELPADFGRGVARMLTGAMQGNLESAVDAAKEIGFEFGGDDQTALQMLIFKLLGAADKGNGQSIFEVLAKSPVTRIPPDFPLIVRAMILLNGLSYALAPGKQVIQRAMLAELQSF